MSYSRNVKLSGFKEKIGKKSTSNLCPMICRGARLNGNFVRYNFQFGLNTFWFKAIL